MARYISDQQTAGNDTVWGTYFAETITGGAGNDQLEGGSNYDTYIYNLGDGDDVIYDNGEPNSYGADILSLGSGITTSNILLSRVATDRMDIRITFNGQQGSILLNDQNAHNVGVETIIFADGTTWTHTQIVARYIADQQTSGNDTVWGTYFAETISCGAGNDRLEGGSNYDTYSYTLGDGDDVISDNGEPDSYGSDILAFGAGITMNDVIFSRPTADTSNLRVTFTNGSGSILIEHQAWYNQGIELFTFANGTSLTQAQVAALTIDEGGGNFMVARPSTEDDEVEFGGRLSTGDAITPWMVNDGMGNEAWMRHVPWDIGLA